jgi:HD-GYP domain-containing protein (c-di-GMP phosphodiesterase class II)
LGRLNTKSRVIERLLAASFEGKGPRGPLKNGERPVDPSVTSQCGHFPSTLGTWDMTELPSEALPLTGERWRRRRVLSWMIRTIAVLGPLVASIVTGMAVSRVLPEPSGAIATAIWFAAIFIASMVVLIAIDRFARRLLPLAMLLKLSLVFPDRAPSRLAVALRAGNPRRLAAAAKSATGTVLADDPETVLTLASALNAHDRRTRGHSERVRALSDLLAEELNLPDDDAERLRWAAFLHDIGKLTVPAKVLNKPGALDSREWGIMRGHPQAGQRYTTSLATWLGDWLHAVDQHHEKFDGSGYPDGLAGSEISLAGRIVAVSDAFETMTAVRSYNKPRSPEQAREELSRCAGSHFDPSVVRAMLSVSVGRLRWTVGAAAWLAQIPFLGVPARAGAQVVTSAAGVEAGTGSALGAIAVSVAGVATPLGVMGAAAAASVHAEPPAPATTPARSAGAHDSTGSDASKPTSTGAASDDSTADTLDRFDDGLPSENGIGGPGAGSGPGSGARQGRGGPGAGTGPGEGAGPGVGIPAGGIDNPNAGGNPNAGNGSPGAPGVPNGGVGQGQGQGQAEGQGQPPIR